MKSFVGKFVLTCSLLVGCISAPFTAFAEGEASNPPFNWIEGTGQSVSIGKIADLVLNPGMAYLDAADTRRYLDENGEISSDSDIGSVYPAEENWAVFFEYDEDGHVADDEKDSIDADALLESYKKGTENRNAKLEDTADHLFIDGWETEPHYDETKHALTWALRAHDGNGSPIINSNIRILTREGFLSVVLVTDPDHMQQDAASMEKQVLSGLSTKKGQRYEDFNKSTDKMAEYGLTGLILGGAGLAVAKKAGLIALIVIAVKKFWFVVLAALAPIWRFLRRGRRQNETRADEEGDSYDHPAEVVSEEHAAADRETAADIQEKP